MVLRMSSSVIVCTCVWGHNSVCDCGFVSVACWFGCVCLCGQDTKRVRHLIKIIGEEGVEMLIHRTNKRAEIRLSRRSKAYSKRWKNLNKERLRTFLGAWCGVSILRVSSRHLTKKEPA